MLGAIAGDIIGSCYEYNNIKTTDFPLFHEWLSNYTDDTILTIAVADVLLHKGDYARVFKDYYRRYPADYGMLFHEWATSESLEPYNSFGNGSAMRVSPVGFALETMEEVLAEARRSAEVTHNHPEGVKGAQATAAAVFMARKGSSKQQIRDYVVEAFEYDLGESIDEIRTHYEWDVTCQGSVPPAITAFLESESYEDAIRKAISIGGDSDTIACITGGIAEAFYGDLPADIEAEVWSRLPESLASITREFMEKHCRGERLR